MNEDMMLPGPSWLSTKGEWLDGDHKVFSNNFAVFDWRSPQDSVIMVIWESDPGPFRELFPETKDVLINIGLRQIGVELLGRIQDSGRPWADDVECPFA